MNILITSGGTSEAIDEVRVLTNRSTGHTGAQLARALAARGHQITLLRAATAEEVPEVTQRIFDSFNSLDAALRTLLSTETFDLIVHAAAVSDYQLDFVEVNGQRRADVPHKLPSQAQISLHLKPTYKIIDRLPQYAKNIQPIRVGFKLTSGANAEQARTAAAHVKADWVVHNDTADIQAGRRIFTIYKQGEKCACLDGVAALAEWLDRLMAR